ncbi:hypothetical protein D3C84_573820 [compost metagenome]
MTLGFETLVLDGQHVGHVAKTDDKLFLINGIDVHGLFDLFAKRPLTPLHGGLVLDQRRHFATDIAAHGVRVPFSRLKTLTGRGGSLKNGESLEGVHANTQGDDRIIC